MLQIEGGFPDAAAYTVLPDRMEAATFLSAAAAAGETSAWTGCVRRISAR